VSNLKVEVETLKDKCNGHEKKINDLESRCDTHERVIEMLRQEIVGLKDSQNALHTTYHGERYDLIP
jgi:predicted  nucleic acid-binding Zn-ribbon protein